jgi:Fringe-like
MDIIILVFGCDTIKKYRNQILKIKETWGKTAATYNNVRVMYFLGEKVVLQGEDIIHLHGVGNDYLSASYKQWYGVKYIYEHYKPKFVYITGTDTFINVPKLVLMLSNYDHTKRLYIGGHGERRMIKNKIVYYHDGGAGYVLSYACLTYIYNKIRDVEKYMKSWKRICNKSNYTEHEYNTSEDLFPACDVSVGYLVSVARCKIETIRLDENFFQCNYVGRGCHRHLVKKENIIGCHKMTLTNFDRFQEILLENSYYVGG